MTYGQLAFPITLGIQRKQAFPDFCMPVENRSEIIVSRFLADGCVTETRHNVIPFATIIDGIGRPLGSGIVFDKDVLFQQVLNVANGRVFRAFAQIRPSF